MFLSLSALADTFGDFFFLVDSNIVPGEFSSFQSELVKWVNKRNIEFSKDRVGLAQYGENPKVEFFLNAFQTKQETLNGIDSLNLDRQPGKPSNLSKAIEQANAHYFTREVGGRAHLGYNQSLVIVIKESPADSASWAVRRIEEDGVKVFTIGAGATNDVMGRFARPGQILPSPGWSSLQNFILAEDLVSEGEEHRTSSRT